MLGWKFFKPICCLLFAEAKCHVAVHRQQKFKLFKMAELSDGWNGETFLEPLLTG